MAKLRDVVEKRREAIRRQTEGTPKSEAKGNVEAVAKEYFKADPIKTQRRGGESSEETNIRLMIEKAKKEAAALKAAKEARKGK